MKIYIIGFMGCGKSTIGKKLASYYGYSLVDTDVLFENENQCSISDFFTLHSEEEFRREEQKILYQTGNMNNVIIATGGGMPCFEDNMQWMLQQGTVVYIEMPPLALYNRLINSKKERPLLADKANLQEKIQTLLSLRETIYKKAHVVIQGININMENLVNLLNP